MNKNEFMEYIEENFSIGGESKKLIYNILWFVEHNYYEDEQYHVLSLLLDGTIGLSDEEIRKIRL